MIWLYGCPKAEGPGREHLCIPARRWMFFARWRCVRCDRWFRRDTR